jgi:hypothetical protein
VLGRARAYLLTGGVAAIAVAVLAALVLTPQMDCGSRPGTHCDAIPIGCDTAIESTADSTSADTTEHTPVAGPLVKATYPGTASHESRAPATPIAVYDTPSDLVEAHLRI